MPAPVSLPDPLRPEFAADLEAFPDAPRYLIQIAVDETATRLSGHQEVRYVNAEEAPLTDLYLRLFPNTPGYGGAMTVTHLLVGGVPVTASEELEGSALRLPLDPPLAVGQAITLTMDFSVAVPTDNRAGYAQFSVIRGVTALPNAYPLIPAYDDEGWNVEVAPEYGDAVYSDIALFAVQVTAPPELTLIASGSCQQRAEGDWVCLAGPMRDFALFLGREYRSASKTVDGVVVNSYYYPENESGGLAALEQAADAVAFYSDTFGPYPYTELDVVETPTEAGGIEYPGLVVIGDFFYGHGDPSYTEWVIAHEVAHQWWYALVGNDQVDEPWLDEALAQYSALLYFETQHGAEMADNILQSWFVETYNQVVERGQDMPVNLPVAAYVESGRYSDIVYSKGPLYFHALRQAVGDEAFFDILRTYYEHNRYGVATAEDWLEAVETVSGDRQQAIFDKWIAGG